MFEDHKIRRRRGKACRHAGKPQRRGIARPARYETARRKITLRHTCERPRAVPDLIRPADNVMADNRTARHARHNLGDRIIARARLQNIVVAVRLERTN